MVLIHGAWGDHHNWDDVVPSLAEGRRVLTYDRRGHSQSERLPAQGSIEEDVADLKGLLSQMNLAPAHVVGNSFGASIALKLACRRPDLFATLTIHEPPLIGLLGDDPLAIAIRERLVEVVQRLEGGDTEGGTKHFVETVAFGPGAWAELSEDTRRKLMFNASTFLDEYYEPDAYLVDLEALSRFDRPVLMTRGSRSPSYFRPILDQIAAALPNAAQHTFHGAGHVPQLTHPREFVSVIEEFVRRT